MEKKISNKRKLFALVCVVALLALCTASLLACNETGGQEQLGTVSVNFDAQNGSGIENKLVSPSNITYLPPAREGYDFVGWTMDKDGNEPLDPSKIKLGTTLYGQWKIKTFTVYFYVNDELVKTQVVEYGKAAIAPTQEEINERLEDGEVFENWAQSFDNVKGDVFVYANVGTASATVKFVVDGNEWASHTGSYGNEIPSVDKPNKNGFVFDKWVDQNGNTLAEGATFKISTTYTAVWQLAVPNAPTIASQNRATYGENPQLTLTHTGVDGITYTYEWYLLDKKVGEGKTITVSAPAAGSYVYDVYTIASCNGYENKTSVASHTTLNVEKATLVASIDDFSIVYGNPFVNPKVRYEGFIAGDDKTSVDESNLTFDTEYTTASPVGNYMVTAKGLVANNYEIVGTARTRGGISATLTVTKRDFSVNTAAETKTYDGKSIAKTYDEIVASGLVDGHKLSLSLTTTGSNVGIYDKNGVSVEYTLTDANGNDVKGNYNEVALTCSFTITKAQIEYELPANPSCNYDGTPHGATIDVATGFEAEYSVDGETWSATAPTFVDAGKHTVRFRIEKENYESVNSSFIVTVNKASVTFTASNQTSVYGKAFSLDQTAYTVSGKTFGNVFDVALTTKYALGNGIGEYAIEIAVKNDANFEISVNNGTLSVTPAPVRVSVIDQHITFGDEFSPTVDMFTASGIYAGDDVKDVVKISTKYKQGNDNGEYALTCTVDNANYILEGNAHALVYVAKRNITVKVNDVSVIYGDALDLANCTFSVEEGALVGNDNIVLSYTCTYTQGDDAGLTKDIIATATASDNYVVTVKKGTLSVAKRPVSVKATDASVIYGENAPTFAYEVMSGNFYGTAPTPHYDCAYSVGDTKAEYAIGVSFEDGNHEITIQNGTLTLEKRNIAVSFSKTAAYQNGQKVSVNLALATVDGEYVGDTLGGILTTKDFAQGEYVLNGERNDFDITEEVNVVNAQGEDVTALYNIEYNVKVIVNEQLIDHTANPVKETYDGTAKSITIEAASDVTVTYSTDGVTYTSGNPTFVNAGTYTVFYRLEQAGKTTTEDKTTVTISKRNATVIALDQKATYGEDFTLADSFKTENVINEADVVATLSCNYVKGNDAGTYAITITINDNDNYVFTAQNGTLTVGKKNVTVTASGFDTIYGEDADLTNFTVDVADAKRYISLKSDYVKGEDAGTYAVRAISSNDNYSVTIDGVNLVVAKRVATVKANDVTVTYGTTPNFSFTASNMFGNDSVTSVTFECSGKNASESGYAIIPSVTDTQNYTFMTENGVLVIKKATLTVDFDNIPSITYGDELPEITIAQYHGFVYGEDQSVLGGTLKVTCAYTSSPMAGTFDITFSGLALNNYEIEYEEAQLVVNKATLTLTADDIAAIAYGDNVPSVTYTASGFKFDDEARKAQILANVIVTIDTAYVKGSDATANGYSYNLTIEPQETDNYILTHGISKKFVVNKAKYVGISHKNVEGGTYFHAQLSEYALQEDFYWDDENAYPTCDVTQYFAHYNADPTNYETFDLYITLILAKATPTITATVNDDANNWTGNEIDLAALISATSNNLDNGTVTIPALKGTDGGFYYVTLTTSETTNYLATSKQVSVRIKAAKIGEKWYTVEEAIATGGAITLAGNAFISQDVTIKNGTTLTLPSGDGTGDSATTIGNAEKAYGAGQGNYVDTNASFVNLTLTVNNGTTVDVSGNVLILGLLGRAGAGLSGHTSGKHSQIVNNGTITLNSGSNLDVRGYIKGNGTINAESGANVYSPFVVHDFRGGTNTVTVFRKEKISPFVQYEMPNIQCEQFFRSGATHTGYFDLYAGSQHNYCSKPIIATKGMIQLTSGYVHKTYNNQRTSLTIAGNANLGSLSLTITMKINVTVNMSDVTFAIPWMYDIRIGDGTTATTLNAPYDYKILPGASITVEKNATLTTSKSIIVYSSFTDTPFGGSVYPEKSAATFVVNGTYNINGSFGGNIQSTQAGAKVVVGSKAKLSVNEVEGNSGGTSATQALFSIGWKFIKVFDITETARFGTGTCNETITPKTYKDTEDKTVNYNEVVRSYSGGTALEKGKTYTYNGTAWA